MVRQDRTYTTDEFFAICRLPENEDKRLELDDGVIIVMGSSSKRNTVTAMRLAHFLNAFVIPRDLGYVTGPDGGYLLAAGRVRRPDVGFIAAMHGITLDGVEFDRAPDLAVEVVSPDEDVFKKANEYLQAGGNIVWAVYVDERTIHVMRLDDDGGLRSLPHRSGDTLDGGDVLPGFTLAVDNVFPR